VTAATTELASPEVTGPDGRTSLGAELPRQVAARALADAAAIIVWGWLATALARVLIAPDQFDVGAYLTVLLVVALVACLYALPVVRRSADLLTPVTLLGMVVLAGAIAAFDAQAPHPFFIPNPAVSLVGAAALVTGLMLGTWLGVVSVVALTLWHGWWEFGAPSGATSGGYLASLVTAATNFAGARFVASSLVHSARQVGGMLTRLLAERRADQLRRVHENSRVRALTDVHDTVLTTLSGVGGGWLSSSDPAALRAELNRDLQVLDDLAEPQETGPVDLAEALRGLVRSSRFSSLDVRVDAPTSVLVDADVADELTLAAREALVNVVKHADVAAASVELSERDGTLEIVVRDEGRGALDALGHGLGTRGIAARMAEVGGQATLTSTPGSGTTVTLTRPQRPVGAVPPLWSVEGPLRGATGLTAVAAVATTVAFALQAPGYADLGPHLWALLVAIVADALAIGVVLRQRRMPGWLSALLIAALDRVDTGDRDLWLTCRLAAPPTVPQQTGAPA
jgi:signal transduction histidine kinase